MKTKKSLFSEYPQILDKKEANIPSNIEYDIQYNDIVLMVKETLNDLLPIIKDFFSELTPIIKNFVEEVNSDVITNQKNEISKLKGEIDEIKSQVNELKNTDNNTKKTRFFGFLK